MNHHSSTDPLDLARWRNVPLILMVAGAVLALLGFVVRPTAVRLCLAVGLHVFPEPLSRGACSW